MKEKSYWCTPADILAILVIVGGLILLSLGKDGVVATLLLSVCAFYFGLKSEEPGGKA